MSNDCESRSFPRRQQHSLLFKNRHHRSFINVPTSLRQCRKIILIASNNTQRRPVLPSRLGSMVTFCACNVTRKSVPPTLSQEVFFASHTLFSETACGRTILICTHWSLLFVELTVRPLVQNDVLMCRFPEHCGLRRDL